MPPDNYSIAAIILAAGKSQRFGSQKMLFQHRGRSLLSHTIAAIDQSIFTSTTIVTGSDAEAIQSQHQSTGLNFVYNSDYATGMGHSIAIAVKQVRQQHTLDAILILLGDQIYITKEELNQLVVTARQNPQTIVCARYQTINGAPAIFPATDFDQLTSLSGDHGAKVWLNSESNGCISVAMPNAARDIDIPADLQ